MYLFILLLFSTYHLAILHNSKCLKGAEDTSRMIKFGSMAFRYEHSRD